MLLTENQLSAISAYIICANVESPNKCLTCCINAKRANCTYTVWEEVFNESIVITDYDDADVEAIEKVLKEKVAELLCL